MPKANRKPALLEAGCRSMVKTIWRLDYRAETVIELA